MSAKATKARAAKAKATKARAAKRGASRSVTICDYSRPPYPYCETYRNVVTKAARKALASSNTSQVEDDKYSIQIDRLTKQQLDKIIAIIDSNIKIAE